MNNQITICDFGMGNLGSIHNMFKYIGVASIITSNPQEIESAARLVFAGVGAFDRGMENIQKSSLLDIIQHKVHQQKTPILGICLGMQLMTEKSEEGERPGLGWFKARTVRFKFDSMQPVLKVPHMGWNTVNKMKANPLTVDLENQARFYFVHSYHVLCDDPGDVLLSTTYGYEFPSAIQKENIHGVQFHPEKSHKYGMHFLRKFAEA
jgi:glutamine amidotransferase